MEVMLVQVDAFAREQFEGNPAAVCLLPGSFGETWMRKVAREMNLSETAFLLSHSIVNSADGKHGGRCRARHLAGDELHRERRGSQRRGRMGLTAVVVAGLFPACVLLAPPAGSMAPCWTRR